MVKQRDVKYFKRKDGTTIRYAVHNAEKAERFLVFINGRTEWIEKYPLIPEWLGLTDECGFLSWDHRGQGASGGARAYIDCYSTFADDARVILEKVCGERPYNIIAHSMGALITLYGALAGKISPESIVLSSPLFLLPDKPLPRWFARPVAHVFSTIGLGRVGTGAGNHDTSSFDGNKLTHDRSTYEKIMKTPYPVPSATYGWVDATFRATDYVFSRKNLARLSCPTMVLTGGDERVVDVAGKYQWCELVSQLKPDLQLKTLTIPGARHELFSESDEYRDSALADIKAFLNEARK